MAIDIDITYNNNIIASLTHQDSAPVIYSGDAIDFINAPGTKTLACANKYMTGNIEVGSTILSCGNKIMTSNVTLTATTSAFALGFTLTVSGTTYTFTQATATNSVSNIYSYVKDTESNDWYLIVYSTGTLNFTTLQQNLDICAVGGGGGGGGAYANATASVVTANNGGNGGGGFYEELYNQQFLLNTDYTLTVGAAGSRGTGNGTSGSSGSASHGGNGGDSSIVTGEDTILTAAGGPRGTRGTASAKGTNGSGGSAQYCFGDSTYPSVSGGNRNSYKGGGGKGGTATAYWNAQGGYQNGGNGTAGAKGLIIVKSTIYSSTDPVLDFLFIHSSTIYEFNSTTETHTESGIYSYTKDTETGDWDIIFYVSGQIMFKTLTTNIDICGVGGGGGGGGAYANATSTVCRAHDGANGGGGYYNESTDETLTQYEIYGITIGSAGSAGSGSGIPSAPGTPANGGHGGTTALKLGSTNIFTAAGGSGGGQGTANSDGSSGSGGSAQYCFSDENYPHVSGVSSNRGGAGSGGTGAYAYWNSSSSNYFSGPSGTAGKAGLLIIRNKRTATE